MTGNGHLSNCWFDVIWVVYDIVLPTFPQNSHGIHMEIPWKSPRARERRQSKVARSEVRRHLGGLDAERPGRLGVRPGVAGKMPEKWAENGLKMDGEWTMD